MQKLTLVCILVSAVLLSIHSSEAQNTNEPSNPTYLQNYNPNLNNQNQPNFGSDRNAIRSNQQSNRRTRPTRSSRIQPDDSAANPNSAASRFSRTINPPNAVQGAAPSLPTAPGRPDSPSNPPSAPSGGDGGIQIQGARSSKYQTGFGKDETEEQIRQNASLYLRPSKSVAVIHQPVTVDVVLSNKKKLEYDRLSFLLHYDPKDVLLTSGKDAAGDWIKIDQIPIPTQKASPASVSGEAVSKPEFLAGDASVFQIAANSIDDQKGLIFFDMKTVGKPSTLEGAVLSLTLVPLRETVAHVSFEFINPFERDPAREPFTRMMLGDRDQLGASFSQADGVIHLDLPIYESLDKAKRQPQILKAGESTEKEEDGASIELSLAPRRSEINVGEIVNVDVVISNPDRKVFDSVNLLIAFNNRVFEPVDADERAPGVNIADQEYLDKFPFDFPVVNIVDKEKGIIDYRKKAMRKPCRSEGVIATIQLRAVRPTMKTTFRLFLSETRQEPTTGLSYRYQDRLGDPHDPFDGVFTCSLGVRATTAYLDKINR
ncbi:MAG: hypothetical protein JXR73_21240 [Candidatus Omnitrophica bacterium]|nr:hypothetical protein [Candidatus Omnitrophota bacterium]